MRPNLIVPRAAKPFGGALVGDAAAVSTTLQSVSPLGVVLSLGLWAAAGAGIGYLVSGARAPRQGRSSVVAQTWR